MNSTSEIMPTASPIVEAGELSYVEVLESPWLSASISKTTTPRLLSSMAAKSCFSPVSA